jgi:ribosomal protein S18 acetylase RimI-like enzyme
LDTDTQLFFAANGQPAGCALFMEETPPTPYDVDTWVHPAFAEAGVGEALLQWVDQRAQQALAKAPVNVPVTMEHVYVYVQNQPAQQRLESYGHRRARVFYRMAIDFNAPPPEP